MLISVVRRLFHSLQHVCLWWHSSIPFSTQEDPLGPGISQRPLLLHHPRDGPGKHLISYPNKPVCPHMHKCRHTHMHKYTHANTNTVTHKYTHEYTLSHTTNHHLHTQYLLLYHIAVNPVKKLCGERK